MSLAKSLTATVAAAAMVGAIGFAYAQTAAPAGPNVNDQSTLQQTPSQPTTPSTGSSMNNSAAPSTSTDSSMNNSSTPASSNDTTAYSERAAQADRN